jgi:uncharacterized DUF497 family protein
LSIRSGVKITWDPGKAVANEAIHRVTFAEAATVLEDGLALTREDPDAIGEQRFATLGLSGEGNVLVVIYTYRDPDEIRIISAWKANKPQRVRYEKGRG